MGIFDWFKKKETPAQIAKRRIESMPRERNQETTTPTSHPPEAQSLVAHELPALDPSILAQPTTWGSALSVQEEPQRNPADVKQKILEHLAERPQQRQWKKSDLQPAQDNDELAPPQHAQGLEQIRFDQVGVEIEPMSQHKKG